MSPEEPDVTPRAESGVKGWLWSGILVGIALAVGLVLALIAALAWGWNDPRPGRVADWRDPGLPRRLEAAPGATTVSLRHHSGGDFTWEATARPVSSPESGFYGYGLAYRAQSPSRYYVFAIGGDGYYAVLRVDGDEETPLIHWQQFPHVQRGPRPNRLRATCAGPTCDFSINDEYAATVEDETWLSGEVGFWTSAENDPVAVQFRDARLWMSDR